MRLALLAERVALLLEVERLLSVLVLLRALLFGGLTVACGQGPARSRRNAVEVAFEAIGLKLVPRIRRLVLLEHRVARGAERAAALDGFEAPGNGGENREHS